MRRSHRALTVGRGEVAHQLEEILRKGIGVAPTATKRPRRHRVGSRRASQRQIDAAGKERLERAELLGDDERRVIRQHDAAGAHTYRRRLPCHGADDDRGGRARDRRNVVMLGQPVAVIAPAFCVPRQIDRVLQRPRRVATLHDGRKIED